MATGSKLAMTIYNRCPVAVRTQLLNNFARGRTRAKFGPAFHATMTDLARTQWYDAQALAEIQAEKLRAIVHYAYTFVPYYTKLFDELGLAPGQIRSPGDLKALPVMDKADLQMRGDNLRSRLYLDHAGVEVSQSSGTTGRPIRVWVDRDCLQIEKAFMWFHRSWSGVHLGDRLAAFLGFPVVPVRQTRPPFWVKDRAENRIMYSLQHLSRENLPAYAESLLAAAPHMIYGYPTAISLIAQHLNERGITDVRPRAVYTSSETVLPRQRAEIERAFACRVMDWYGASEMVANIVQCEHGSYHIKPEYGVVEVLKPDGTPALPGEPGTLVGTGLNNRAMPLIRYRVGDSVVRRAGTCPCGRGGDLVQGIIGRIEDVVVTPEGRLLTRLDHVFKGIHGVEEAQLVQEVAAELRVRLVRKPDFRGQDEREILTNLRSRLGDGIAINFEYLERIPRTKSGKFRFVVSKVPLPEGGGRQADQAARLAEEDDVAAP